MIIGSLVRKIKQKFKRQLLKRVARADLRVSLDFKDIGPPGPLINNIFIKLCKIRGFFNIDDLSHFHIIFSMQSVFGIKGDMLEIGSYHGRSTAAIAGYLRNGEKLHVCDTFLLDAEDYYDDKPSPKTLLENVLSVHNNCTEEKIVIYECLSSDLQLELELPIQSDN